MSFNAILGIVFGVASLGVAQSLVLLSSNPSAVTVGLRSVVGMALLALVGFLVFSLTMAALMVVVSVVASTSRRRLLRG